MTQNIQSSDGLAKLTEYLAQTRRQAEKSIDVLNERITELTKEKEEIATERDYFRNYSEQLKLENSKKWRLQERDDWKSLVESVQKDRNRLHDDCIRLEATLEEAQQEIQRLQEEITMRDRIIEEERSKRPNGNNTTGTTQSPTERASRSNSAMGEDDLRVVTSPSTRRVNLRVDTTDSYEGSGGNVVDGGVVGPESGSGSKCTTPACNPNNSESPSLFSPRTMSKKLQQELEKAHNQMEVERRTAEAERLAQEAEINRLQEELQRFRSSQPGNGARAQGLIGGRVDTAGTLTNGSAMVGKGLSGSGVHGDTKGSTTSQHGGSSSWFSPLGFLSYLFSPSPVAIKDGAPVISV